MYFSKSAVYLTLIDICKRGFSNEFFKFICLLYDYNCYVSRCYALSAILYRVKAVNMVYPFINTFICCVPKYANRHAKWNPAHWFLVIFYLSQSHL